MRTRRIAVQAAESQLSSLDMVLAEQTAPALETLTQILRSTADTVELIERNGTQNFGVLADVLRRRIEGIQQIAGVAVTDHDGTVLSSTFPVMTQTQTGQVHVVVASMAAGAKPPYIGEPFRDATGSWTALMICPIAKGVAADNRYAIGFINLRYFEDLYQAVQLSDNGAVSLHLLDGTVLARYPHVESIIGTTAANPPFKTVPAHSSAGTLVLNSLFDRIRRVEAIRPLPAYPLAVDVSVSESDILRAWRHQAIVMAVLAVFASLLIGGLLLLLAARARQREVLVTALSRARQSALKSTRRLEEQMLERERAEEALLQIQRIEAVGQLSGGVAHDFNNLLTVVLTNIEMLTGSGQFEGEYSAMLQQARAAAERGAVMTGQLLAFSRQQPLRPAPVDLRALLIGMEGLLHTALGETIGLDMRLEARSPAMADGNQTELMILNLALNARDAMPAGGKLIIMTRDVIRATSALLHYPPGGEYVLIEVADTGTGMTEDVRGRAFDPFFTTKEPGIGSGLGLSQVYGLARQSGGLAEIESEPNRGTTIRIWLPQADPTLPVAVKTITRPAPAVSEQATILVVDDDAAVRGATVRMLRRSGYTVLEDDSAEPALERLMHDSDVSMVVSDIVMPGMNGLDLARAVREVHPDLPFVFISGYADPVNVAAESGPLRLLRKPFRSSDLIAEIEAVLTAKAKPADIQLDDFDPKTLDHRVGQ